ncbi:MAG: histidinol-phosphate transaminase [Alphaproteobacteria bacterium]|nr:histidinol-phosphate transaminase [Alphaproteobacteria bacterium]
MPHNLLTMTQKRPQPNPGISEISPYIPAETEKKGIKTIYRLSANETPLGPSPASQDAYKKAVHSLAHYPDGNATLLREAIAHHHGLDPRRLICGAGSDELLTLIARAYLTYGTEALHSEYGFLLYPIITKAAGAQPVMAPEKNMTTDVNALLNRVTGQTRVIFLAHPNNPTGTYLPTGQLCYLHKKLPPHILLVLDAAYGEYVRKEDYTTGIDLIDRAENVVMTRTFSKLHGLASLRLGWLYGPPSIIETLNRIRGPFNVSSPALAAGVAAITDHAHINRCLSHNDLWLPWLTEQIGALTLKSPPSTANFLLLDFDNIPGKYAADAHAYLEEKGINLRRLDAYALPNALRMTVGTEDANIFTINMLREFLRQK